MKQKSRRIALTNHLLLKKTNDKNNQHTLVPATHLNPFNIPLIITVDSDYHSN